MREDGIIAVWEWGERRERMQGRFQAEVYELCFVQQSNKFHIILSQSITPPEVSGDVTALSPGLIGGAP